MPSSKYYTAGSVPRFIRQTKLGYLPLNCLLGSKLIRGDGGVNLIMDIIILPAPEFQRMRSNVGLRHVMAPMLKADASFQASFIIIDAKMVTVPPNEPDPEGYARHYFMTEFGLLTPEKPQDAPEPPPAIEAAAEEASPFSRAATACTVRTK